MATRRPSPDPPDAPAPKARRHQPAADRDRYRSRAPAWGCRQDLLQAAEDRGFARPAMADQAVPRNAARPYCAAMAGEMIGCGRRESFPAKPYSRSWRHPAAPRWRSTKPSHGPRRTSRPVRAGRRPCGSPCGPALPAPRGTQPAPETTSPSFSATSGTKSRSALASPRLGRRRYAADAPRGAPLRRRSSRPYVPSAGHGGRMVAMGVGDKTVRDGLAPTASSSAARCARSSGPGSRIATLPRPMM